MELGPTSQSPPAILGLYRNNKNGGIYTALTTVTNTTNAQDRQQMVLYVSGAQLFVRERAEFLQKFTPITPGGMQAELQALQPLGDIRQQLSDNARRDAVADW